MYDIGGGLRPEGLRSEGVKTGLSAEEVSLLRLV